MSTVTETLLQLLAAVLAAATPILVGFAIQWIRKQLEKAGFETSEKELAMIRALAEEGVAFAAQSAKVKVKTGGAKLTGAQKKNLAVAFAKKLALKNGVTPSSVDVLDDMIEAALGRGLDDSSKDSTEDPPEL